VDRVALTGYPPDLREVTLAELPNTVASGIPSKYAYYNDTLKLWPTPDAAYTVQITGLAQIDAPTADADENAWTTEARALIVNKTKETLYRGQFRDREAAADAEFEVAKALAKLKRETAKRLTTPLRPRMARQAFNITTGV
jgi:hypothetical protein